VSSQTDYPGVDTAQAFAFTASREACASTLTVYLALPSSPALVGVYADAQGSPGTLLASALLTAPQLQWNTVTLSKPVSLHKGDKFWIAVASATRGDAGAVWFRDESAQVGASFAGTLAPTDGGWALPQAWKTAFLATEDKLSATLR
jgi:hypothetical protein